MNPYSETLKQLARGMPHSDPVRHALEQAADRIEVLEDTLDAAWRRAELAPEINPSNYNHDEVCELNTAMC